MQTTISGAMRHATRAIIPLLCATVLLGACSPPQPPQLNHATLLPSAKPLLDFTLIDQNRQPFTQGGLLDRWTFAFFGYTHCPDVCPTALTMLVQLHRKLEAGMPPDEIPAVVFFSVDPERDTPEQLAKFIPYFHPAFLGVTGDAEQMMRLTRQIGILHAKAEDASDDNYLVDHSAAIVLFDPNGKFHAVFGVPHDPDLIAADFLAIREYYEATQ